mgnify:CR=1 FL=1|jgi:hypothetical protein|tara:strand:- start:4457 stop:5131 length:675 start_codon:yes stop_codon:yes gene_type:complete
MTKKDIKEIIEKESESLNTLLETNDLSDFKVLVGELRDTYNKKQMFRTETEARFSVLQDNKYPTLAAKYWQCVREQAAFFNNLMGLSFEYRRNNAKIKWLQTKIEKETDEYKLTRYQVDIDECVFKKTNMEREAKERMREIKMWSKLKKEFNDGSFDDKDVNQHQLDSYGLQYFHRAKNLHEGSDDNEKFNVLGQLQSLQRIKKSGELENKTVKKEELAPPTQK